MMIPSKYRNSVSAKIDRYLLDIKRKPGKILGYGSYVEIASKFDVSRELVRQRAKIVDVSMVFKILTKTCPICGKKFRSKNYQLMFCSNNCKKRHTYYLSHELIRCYICGSGILRRKAEMNRSKTKKYYCSRKCLGKSDHLKELGNKLTNLYGADYYKKISKIGNDTLMKKQQDL
jgi:hypothetical protein